jgi:hypothetical protein
MEAVTTPGLSANDTQTRPDNTTAYDALDVVGQNPADNITFGECGGVAGGHVMLTGAWLRIAKNAVPSGMGAFRLHLYNASPTAIADGSAFNLIAADRAKYLGYIDLPTPVDVGDTLWSQVENVNKKVKLASASKYIYGVLQTIAGYTPASEDVVVVGLEGLQC